MQLTGTADRVERDPDGRIRIVDFKTGRSEPRRPTWRCRTSWASTSWPWPSGAFAETVGPDARPGGAELVYLRLPDAGGSLPKVFHQASLDDVPFPVADDDFDPELAAQPTWVHRRLPEAARVIRSERFDARVGPACRYCPFRSSCPAQLRGSAGGRVTSARAARSDRRLRRRGRPDRGARDAVLRPAAGGDHRAARAGGDHRRRRVGQDHGDGGPGGLAGRHRGGATGGGARTDLHPQGGCRAVGTGAVRAAARRGRPAGRGRRVRRAADHDLRRVRGPAGRRARPAARGTRATRP